MLNSIQSLYVYLNALLSNTRAIVNAFGFSGREEGKPYYLTVLFTNCVVVVVGVVVAVVVVVGVVVVALLIIPIGSWCCCRGITHHSHRVLLLVLDLVLVLVLPYNLTVVGGRKGICIWTMFNSIQSLYILMHC